MSFVNELQHDCEILLNRALKGKSIACFGVDGFGQHGQSDTARSYVVQDVGVMLHHDNDSEIPSGIALLFLDGYDATEFGHICSDQNFEISMNKLLKEHEIVPESWDWADIGSQLQHTVVLNIDIEKLLDWA